MNFRSLTAGFIAAMSFSAAHAQNSLSPQTVLDHYGALVSAGYTDALAGAKTLQQAVDEFVAAPSEAGLFKARNAWLAARDWYGQTEAFRFYGGPIDGKNGPEGRMNAWPMDESYVDSVQEQPQAGIINNRKVRIDAKTLSGLNEKDGEENIATGWHAIEFLLWGQDLYADSPGRRAYTDFVDGKGLNADRRRLYLKVVTDLIVHDLTALEKAWAPGAKNYRAQFVKNPANVSKLISGLGILTRGELAGERIEVALDSQSQEDEHSCFSDNTNRDIAANALGIRNVWRGEYARPDGSVLEGASLRDLVAAKDKSVADKLDALMDASVKAAQAIPAPFDQAVLKGNPGRAKIEATVQALKDQAVGIVEAAQVLGIKRLNTALPQ